MKFKLSVVLAAAALTITASPAQARDQWTKSAANGWYAGQPWLVGLYLSGSAVLTLIALALSKETKDVDYDTNIGLGETGSL